MTVQALTDFSTASPAGTALNAGNSGGATFTNSAGNSSVSTTQDALGGSAFAALFTIPSAANTSALGLYSPVGWGHVYAMSYIFNITTNASTNSRNFLTARAIDATPLWSFRNVRVSASTYTIRFIRPSGSAQFTTTEVFNTNQRYRLEMVLDYTSSTNQIYSVSVYDDVTGVAVTSTPYTYNGSAMALVKDTDQIQIGMPSMGVAASMAMIVSNLRYNLGGTSEIGPIPIARPKIGWGIAA